MIFNFKRKYLDSLKFDEKGVKAEIAKIPAASVWRYELAV